MAKLRKRASVWRSILRPEDISKLIRELVLQEAAIKAKEEAIKQWSATLGEAAKANEIDHEEDTKKWQKVLDAR
jgi:hypothetical protein